MFFYVITCNSRNSTSCLLNFVNVLDLLLALSLTWCSLTVTGDPSRHPIVIPSSSHRHPIVTHRHPSSPIVHQCNEHQRTIYIVYMIQQGAGIGDACGKFTKEWHYLWECERQRSKNTLALENPPCLLLLPRACLHVHRFAILTGSTATGFALAHDDSPATRGCMSPCGI